MSYAPKGNAKDKRTRGRRNMRVRQDDDIVIFIIWLSPTSFDNSRHPVDLSSPALSRLVEDEYRMGC